MEIIMTLKNIQYEIIKECNTLVEKRIENWEIGIGLNKVDGLTSSWKLCKKSTQRKKWIISWQIHHLMKIWNSRDSFSQRGHYLLILPMRVKLEKVC
ncbi:MAG: hypothetical protein ACRC6K_02920 [Fusobacteriaceae bacterium]